MGNSPTFVARLILKTGNPNYSAATENVRSCSGGWTVPGASAASLPVIGL